MTLAAVGSPARRDATVIGGLCVAGCAMLAFATFSPWIVSAFGYRVFVPALAAAGLIAILATRLSSHVPARIGVPIVLGFALAMRLVLVQIEPLMSTDLYRYVWDGRVQGSGVNPYRHVPADPALASLRDAAIYSHINRADYALTGYPPVAQMFFFAVTRVSEWRSACLGADAGCVRALPSDISATQ